MLKISAHVSKKVPLPNQNYSSQQFGASLELEVADGQKAEEIQEKLRRLYAVIKHSIDEQIGQAANGNGGNGQQAPAAKPATGGSGNGSGGGKRFVPATAAQQRAVYALCKAAKLEMEGVLAEYGVKKTENLGIKQASELIDKLKARQQ